MIQSPDFRTLLQKVLFALRYDNLDESTRNRYDNVLIKCGKNVEDIRYDSTIIHLGSGIQNRLRPSIMHSSKRRNKGSKRH